MIVRSRYEKAPDSTNPVRDENLRGATLFHGNPCALRSAITLPATDVCPHVTEYLIPENIFPCALCGPFDKLPLDPALTLPDSLCAHEYLYLRFNGLVVYSIKFFI